MEFEKKRRLRVRRSVATERCRNRFCNQSSPVVPGAADPEYVFGEILRSVLLSMTSARLDFYFAGCVNGSVGWVETSGGFLEVFVVVRILGPTGPSSSKIPEFASSSGWCRLH